MPTRILWIEGNRAEGPSFVPDLEKKGYLIDLVPTGNAAMARVFEFGPDLVVLNAASMRTTGKRICRAIRDSANSIPIILITSPQYQCDDICANTILTLPFTTRKLLNRIPPLVKPGGKKQIHKGPLMLDMEMLKVRCQGRESRITPRMASILKVLVENAGVVVERDTLFCRVWNTEYTGDTRTLDVHVNWLRQAIEENPHNPQFLKTIRGVGFRLDV
jgi:DNA-binding response OmpR family regulator